MLDLMQFPVSVNFNFDESVGFKGDCKASSSSSSGEHELDFQQQIVGTDSEQGFLKHKLEVHSRENASACSAKRRRCCVSGSPGSCPKILTIDQYCEACHG
jgi:hypothetical protein